jgi:hypothetical protein
MALPGRIVEKFRSVRSARRRSADRDGPQVATRLLVDRTAQEELREETDPIKKAGMALRQYVPVEVTSFYLMFFAAAGSQTADKKKFAQWILLPVLGLAATIAVSMSKNWDPKSTEQKWWEKVTWPGVAVSTLAFVGWVYVTGGQFFALKIDPFIVSVVFAFLGIVVPAVYGMTLKPSSGDNDGEDGDEDNPET